SYVETSTGLIEFQRHWTAGEVCALHEPNLLDGGRPAARIRSARAVRYRCAEESRRGKSPRRGEERRSGRAGKEGQRQAARRGEEEPVRVQERIGPVPGQVRRQGRPALQCAGR